MDEEQAPVEPAVGQAKPTGHLPLWRETYRRGIFYSAAWLALTLPIAMLAWAGLGSTLSNGLYFGLLTAGGIAILTLNLLAIVSCNHACCRFLQQMNMPRRGMMAALLFINALAFFIFIVGYLFLVMAFFNGPRGMLME